MSRRSLVLSLLLLTGLVFSALPTAQTQQPVDLFLPAPSGLLQPAATTLARFDTVSTRTVVFNPAALTAERLAIEPVGGLVLTAVLQRLDSRPDGSATWNGTIEGQPYSTVTLARVGTAVQGSLRTLDAAFSIEPIGDSGLHVVRQIDTSQYGAELEPLVPPAGLLDTPADIPSVDSGGTFDVLVTYTPGAVTNAGNLANLQARIALGIAETNTGYANSQVIPRLRLVGVEPVTYTAHPSDMSVDLNRLTSTNDGIMDAVHTRRNVLGADLVVLIIENGPPSKGCGIAWLMTPATSAGMAPYAFSVTAYTCISPNYTFGHELGHNMGSNHAPGDDGTMGVPFRPYSYGYKHPGRLFRTVMAYECADGPCPRILNFSNPGVLHNGAPTGTAAQHDNARSLNDARTIVANWRQEVAPPVPPTISAIGPVSTNEDTPTAAIPFTLTDGDTTLDSLAVSASSSNTVLVPNTAASFTFGGSGGSRTLVVTPAPDQFGTTVITVSVSDGGLPVSTTFTLTVNPVNDAPALTLTPAGATVPAGTPTGTVATVSDIDSPYSSLFLSATSDNQTLLPNGNIALTITAESGNSRTYHASMAPVGGQVGTATVTFTAVDFATGVTTRAFVLQVAAPPTVTTIAPQTMNEDTSRVVGFTIGDVDTPIENLTVSAVSSNAAVIAPGGLVLSGAGASRALTITPAANQSGASTITVTVSDGLASASTAFAVTVVPVNDAPVFGPPTPSAVTAGSGVGSTFYVTLTDVDTAGSALTLSAASANQTLLPNANIAVAPGAATANSRMFSVTLTPAASQTGPVQMTLTASDQAATATRPIAVSVVAAVPAPDAPTGASAAAAGSTVTIGWSPATTGAPATSFVVEIGTAPGMTTLPTQSIAAPATSLEVSLPDGTYFVRVRGVNGAGSSTPSPEAAVAVGTAASLPGPPNHFAIATSGINAFLSWTPATIGAPPSTYVIEAGTQQGLADLVVMATGSAATSYAVPNVPPGTYFVRVRGYNAAGLGAPSQDVSMTMGPAGQCTALAGAPALLTPVVAGNTVTLSWNAATTGGAAEGYVIAAGSGPGLSDLAAIDTASTGTSFAAVAPNGLYFVRVAGRNGCGVGPVSNEISFTLGPELPGPPAGLSASVTPDRIVTLTWNAPTTGSAPTAYLIEAGSDPTLRNLAVISTGTSGTSYSVVAPPGAYYVRVRGLNGAGAGAPSNEIVVDVP